MLPDARVVHSSPGRLRIRVPGRRGDAGYFAEAQRSLLGLAGVSAVEVNPLTAGILVTGSFRPAELNHAAETDRLFRLDPPAPPHVLVGRRIAGSMELLDGAVRGLSAQSLDLSAGIFLLLAGSGLWQIAQGNFAAPAWYTAFWYALGVHSKFLSGNGKKSETSGE